MGVGIIGQGFVGKALKAGFEKYYKTNTFDLNGKCNCKNIEDLVDKSDIIFVCVPTPMKKDGSCDTSIVENVVKDINETVNCNQDGKIVAIKSTIPPGTTNIISDISTNSCNVLQVHLPFMSNVFVEYFLLNTSLTAVPT